MITVSPAQEATEGAAAFADVKAKEKISTDAAANERVRRVGQRIATAVGSALPSAQWEFVVFDAPDTVNAFALPGGKVGVYTGLLKLATADDELAIVMGHEIGHVTARHGAERMTQAQIANGLGALGDAATQNTKYHDLLLQAYGLTGNLTILHFSREQESEADHIGIRYAAKAGYDPRAAITFWEKMAKQKGNASTIKWLSTHPPDDQRIAGLQRLMPEAMQLYDAARGIKPAAADRPIGL